jgi:L-lysine exporter family protein LysE/ArgO
VRLFFSGFLLSLSLCLDLGIVNVAVINAGLRGGFKPAFFIGLGSCFGDLLYALAALTAVSVVLSNIVVRQALWIGGTIVLLLLAWRMLRHAFGSQVVERGRDAAPAGRGGSFLRGAGLALASPSSMLWFAAVGGSAIAAHAGDRAGLPSFLGGFFCAGLVWSAALAIVCGWGRRALGPLAVRALLLASAILFTYLAVDVFVRGYRDFLDSGNRRVTERSLGSRMMRPWRTFPRTSAPLWLPAIGSNGKRVAAGWRRSTSRATSATTVASP